MNTVDYLKNLDNFGDRKLTAKGREVLSNLFQKENFKIETAMDGVRDVDLKLVDQAKINNLYARTARANNFTSNLEDDDISISFKKALIALQSKNRSGYQSRNDHISQLIQVGQVPQQIVKSNAGLIKETFAAICDSIIPEKQLTNRIIEAFTARKLRRDVGGGIGHLVLLNTSDRYAEKLEKFGLPINEFSELLELFVDQKWQNHETYNSFIRGFGSKFEDFSDLEAINFISLLVKAGLNQVDILEAVIEKVLASNVRSSQDKKKKMIIDLLITALNANAAESPAFNKLIQTEQLDSMLKGDVNRKLKFTLAHQFTAAENISLLASIVSRADLTQDSRLKELVRINSFLSNFFCLIGFRRPRAGKQIFELQ